MGSQGNAFRAKNQKEDFFSGPPLRRPENLPHLPQVIVKLLYACDDDDTDVQELSRIISTDAALTSRLLEILGSAFLNLPKAPKTIEGAVVYLGMDTIKNIAISVSAMHVFKINSTIPEFNMAAFWTHSYKCAVIAKQIALEQKFVQADEAFLAGLLHEIGSLVLVQNFPADYLPLLMGEINKEERSKAEQNKFGTTTEQVSAWLFKQWDLNPLMADAVLYVNSSPQAIAHALDLVKIIFVANRLAENNVQDPVLASLSRLEPERLDQIILTAEEEVDSMAKSLGIPLLKAQTSTSKDDQPDLQTDRQTQDSENSLALKVKEISLFHGTLQNLLNAETIEEILIVTTRGIKIVFNVPRVFLFLFDEKKDLLNGWSPPGDKHHKLLESIAVPMSNTSSLITTSLLQNQTLNSLETTKNKHLSISDIQITRLLESDGLYCIPMKAFEETIGVIVLGIEAYQGEDLDKKKSLIKLFSRQTARCIQSLNQRNQYSAIVQDQRMQAYTTVTRKIVHEVNNPLVIITNYLTLLSMKLPDKHPAQSELEVIREEIHRISGLIQKLSNFSKPDIAEFESVDINKLYSSSLSIIKKSILQPRAIKTNFIADPDIPSIKTDKNGLKQVLINLIKNSAEAMDKGGEITVKTSFIKGSSRLLIDEKRKTPGNIEISIKDNGPGIPDQIMTKLFEPYNSTKKQANSGLGLSIVHSIIRNLNGNITCKSNGETGTCFTILLPVNSIKPLSHE